MAIRGGMEGKVKGECVRGDVRRGGGTCGRMRRYPISLPSERELPSESGNKIRENRWNK